VQRLDNPVLIIMERRDNLLEAAASRYLASPEDTAYVEALAKRAVNF